MKVAGEFSSVPVEIRRNSEVSTEFIPEIFDTLQGEGRNIGQPATFLRLSNCNLRCRWCDTGYTWAFTDRLAESHDDKMKYERSEQQTELDVESIVDNLLQRSIERLVISGGEPMIQQRGIYELVGLLKTADPERKVEIETNGTIVPIPELVELVDQFNVSPKLENSGNKKEKRDKPNAMKAYVESGKSDFKFVITCDEDLAEVLELIARYEVPTSRVYLMPEGRTQEEQTSRAEAIADLCMQHGFNFTPRLHINLWGTKRGV